MSATLYAIDILILTVLQFSPDANAGTARVEALDANDQAPVFIESSLFGAVEEDARFGTSVTTLEVSI